MKALLVVLLLALAKSTADADCEAMPGSDAAALVANTDEARLAWIQARLARTSHRATIWRDAWGVAILGATAIDLAMIPILGDTQSHRIDFGLGAATTLPGIIPLLFWKPRVMSDHVTLDAHIAAAGGADRCKVLSEAETLLAANAAAQRDQRAWYVHAGNIALNTGVVFLFGAFDHWTSGILNGLGGAAVGELIIFTEPVDQIDDLARYRRGELVQATSDHSWRLVPTHTQETTGLALVGTF